MHNHPEAQPVAGTCAICKWPFADSLSLENHALISGHVQTASSSPQHRCYRCLEVFTSKRSYNNHRKLGQPCSDANHSKDWKASPRPAFDDLDQPKVVLREVDALDYDGNSSGTPSDLSQSQEYCVTCKRAFTSYAAYARHLLGCRATSNRLILDSSPDTYYAPDQNQPVKHKSLKVDRSEFASQALPALPDNVQLSPVSAASPHITQAAPTMAPKLAVQPTHSSPSIGTGDFPCNSNGCQRIYKSEAGLRQHQNDTHGIGGQALDMYGKDAWMLTQKERERAKAQGLLRNAPSSPRGGFRSSGAGRGGRATPASSTYRTAPPPTFPTPRAATYNAGHRVAPSLGIKVDPPLQASQNIGGPLDMEQARTVCGKMMRLLLQTDIFIGHYGKISIGGINWTRIGVERQPTVVGLFNGMCHLPRNLQNIEYLPAPKTYLAEYTMQYPRAEFESAPPRDPTKPGLDVVAVACSKIRLGDGCEEVVKIAAVDVPTCRVLMSYLVCTDPKASVVNWNSSNTGLSSYKDMEGARQAGYKILKGWRAGRAALYSFIDNDTIIVGHNLRSELDALRIMHGRAVDVVKVIEKAADGPLSKAQVSLDSWCRDVADVTTLPTDPTFGRDCVLDAFAAREIGLWAIKNREKFEKVAKQKTEDYQSVMKT